MEVLKKSAVVKIKCIQAQYETAIHQEANELYTLIQRKARHLEDLHKEQIAVLYTSYRNQLADAISMIKGSFKNYYMKNVSVSETDNDVLNEMLAKFEEKSLEVAALTEQLNEQEEKIIVLSSIEEEEDTEKDQLIDENGRLKDENERLLDDIDNLHIDMDLLRDDILNRESNIEELEINLKVMAIKAEEDRMNLQKMTNENSQLKAQIVQDKEATKRKMSQLKKDMEKEISNIEKERQKEANAAEERMKQQKKDLEKAQRTQATAMAAMATKPQESVEEHNEKESVELKRLKSIVEEQKTEIKRFKCDRLLSEAWEKKFDILNKSFHAIKDEMYLRNNLQRQAAALHYASVSYTLDVPTRTPVPNFSKQSDYSEVTPMPDIGATTRRTENTSRMSSFRNTFTETLSSTDNEPQSQREDGDDDN
ncbi:uncharacterized protein C10orf67 homolog, mitochondrial isoform X2 [Engraulis encrasicolus]